MKQLWYEFSGGFYSQISSRNLSHYMIWANYYYLGWLNLPFQIRWIHNKYIHDRFHYIRDEKSEDQQRYQWSRLYSSRHQVENLSQVFVPMNSSGITIQSSVAVTD